MANSEELEEIWWALNEFNEGLRGKLEQFMSDTRVQREICKELVFRKRNGIERVWDLQDEFKLAHSSRLDQWALNEKKIQKLREDLDGHGAVSLNQDLISWVRVHLRQKRAAEDLVSGMSSTMSLPSEGGPTPPLVSGTGSVEQRHRSTSETRTTLESTRPNNTQRQDARKGMIRCPDHLHQLKTYLLQKVESEVFIRKLKQCGLEFKVRVTNFCDSLMSQFVTEDMTLELESDLCLSLPTLMELFLDSLGEVVDEKRRKQFSKSFKKLLKNFTKKQPLYPGRSASCFARRWKVKDQELQRVAFLQEMIHFQEKRNFSLQEQLKMAERKNDEANKERSLREGDQILLGMLLQDAEDELRWDAESFQNLFTEQEAQILEILKEMGQGKGKLEEERRDVQILARMLEWGELKLQDFTFSITDTEF